MRLGDLIKHLSPFPFAGEKTAAMHQPKVLRSKILGNFAVFSDLPHGVTTVEQQLNHPNPHRMSQHFEALGSLAQGFHVCREEFLRL